MTRLISILIVLVVAGDGCADDTPTDPIPAHDTILLEAKAIGEQRRINVHLPVGYADDVERRYPVLYMPDGGIGEDFPHIVATIAALQAEGAIEPHLVVGIENTERRRDLTGPTTVESDKKVAPRVGGSAEFRAFIRDDLIPEIERRYRCQERRSIVGESVAGLFVMETFLLEPGLFQRSIAVSPSLWWNNHALVDAARERLPAHAGLRSVLYLTSADETDIFRFTDQLGAILEEDAPADLEWSYVPRRDLHHHTIFRAVKEDAFRKALGKPEAAKSDAGG